MSAVIGKDYLGSNFISVVPENASQQETVLGTDYLGSKFVAQNPQPQISKNNTLLDEPNYVLGKDYLGSNFISCQLTALTPLTPTDADSKWNVKGTDFLGSTFITNNQNVLPTIDKVCETDLQSTATSIVNDCVKTASKIINDEKPKEETLDILGNGLLVKKIVHKGDGFATRPERGQEVTIKLEIQLKTGEVVESQKEVTFILADRDVPDAIDLSVNLMELNEVATVTSDSKFAYGEKGKSPNIPPNADIIFTISVLEITEGPYNTSVDVKKRIQWVDKKREMGNTLFSDKRYHEATQAYSKCAKVLEQAMVQQHTDDVSEQIKQLTVKCCNNLIASNMKLEMWADALKICKTVLFIEPDNTKALFRKGKILAETGDLKKAVQTLQQASKSNPENKHILNEVTRLTKKLSQQNKARKEMYQKMLGNKNKESKDDPPQTNSSSSTMSLIIGGALVAVGAILVGVYMTHR